ncbi:MAG: acylphosphatase [Bdellovibrionales bacterium]|nr:acylphosphatase [Bdellovibrionales bacterium]
MTCMVTKQIFVSGRVQGVGFRFHTFQKASSLGVVGWVRNLPDGRVEVQAQASDSIMAELIRWLHAGPPAARVDAVSVRDLPSGGVFQTFEIRRD